MGQPQVQVFLGSSTEGLPVAKMLRRTLKKVGHKVRIWTDGVFRPSNYPIPNLVAALRQSDFGVFVFTPDDKLTVCRTGGKKTRYTATRDNVLFEFGLSIGILGLERSYCVWPKGLRNYRQFSDMSGLNRVEYSLDKARLVHGRVLAEACRVMLGEIVRLGHFDEAPRLTPTNLKRWAKPNSVIDQLIDEASRSGITISRDDFPGSRYNELVYVCRRLHLKNISQLERKLQSLLHAKWATPEFFKQVASYCKERGLKRIWPPSRLYFIQGLLIATAVESFDADDVLRNTRWNPRYLDCVLESGSVFQQPTESAGPEDVER